MSDRPFDVELASLWAEIESLKTNLRQVTNDRLRPLEDQMDTFVLTPLWKRLLVFALWQGWPLRRLAVKPGWRPWNCEGCRRRKKKLAAILRAPCGGCGGD